SAFDHHLVGLARYRQGDWPGARQAVEQAMALRDRQFAEDYRLLALIEFQAGNVELAREHAVAAKTKPDVWSTHAQALADEWELVTGH
ncbi:MAG: hypothetical protein KDA60_19705, partial [Planctomycetales bacterium]|nr:hypothetical protein [Planctomycetales bacterium]